MARAYSIGEILAMKYKVLEWDGPWLSAFGQPETSGLWAVCGHSGNGKTGFALQLAMELSKRLGRGIYNSFEQGTRKTLQDELRKHGVDTPEYRRKINFTKEPYSEMKVRFSKHKAPKWVIVDSYSISGYTKEEVDDFQKCFPKVLMILVLRAKGREADGATGRKAWFDADLKVWVEGFKGISHGRTNPGGEYTIWEWGAAQYGHKKK